MARAMTVELIRASALRTHHVAFEYQYRSIAVSPITYLVCVDCSVKPSPESPSSPLPFLKLLQVAESFPREPPNSIGCFRDFLTNDRPLWNLGLAR
jgi:hypothetical protein